MIWLPLVGLSNSATELITSPETAAPRAGDPVLLRTGSRVHTPEQVEVCLPGEWVVSEDRRLTAHLASQAPTLLSQLACSSFSSLNSEASFAGHDAVCS